MPGSSQWVYDGKARSKPVAMPYWSIPEAALDDPEELAKWVRLSPGRRRFAQRNRVFKQ
jgi:DNA transformation protein